MPLPQFDFRMGTRRDSRRIAELDHIASGGAVEFLFHDLVPNQTAIDVVAGFLDNPDDVYSHANAIVATHDNRVIGMALSFPSRFHAITPDMVAFLPTDRLEHFRTFFSTRVENSWYIDALAVDAQFRNTGIGGRLIDMTRQRAVQEGYHCLSLMVFADNIDAQRLYRQHGFETVTLVDLEPHALMPHVGGCLLMKADI